MLAESVLLPVRMNRRKSGNPFTPASSSAETLALATDAHQSARRSTQSLSCCISPAEREPRAPAAAPLREWSGKETRQYAEKQNDDRLEVLLPRLPDVGRALIRCDGENHRCSLPICAVCARAYRQGPIAQLHALAHAKIRRAPSSRDHLPRPVRSWLSCGRGLPTRP